MRSCSLLASPLFLLALSSFAGCGNGIVPQTAQATTTPAVPVATALGPQLGYLWTASTQTLRPILGIAGASQIGQSIIPPGAYVNAASSATASIALLQAVDGSLDLMKLPSGSPVSLNLTLTIGATIRLSPSALSAIAFTPGGTSASLITGLPSAPMLRTVAAPVLIADAAVSDTGTLALESSRGISIVALDGSPIPLAAIGAPGGISFRPDSASSHDDLLFADSAANSLTFIRSSSSNPSVRTVSTTGLLHSPSAIGVSASGRWVLVANSGSQAAVRIDLSSLTATSVACSCQPTLAESLADDGAFRITALASGTNWLVRAALPTPVALFIPALPPPPTSAALASARP